MVRDGNRERARQTPRWAPAEVAWGAVQDGAVMLRDGYTVEPVHTVGGPLRDGCAVVIRVAGESLVLQPDEDESDG